MVSLLMMCPEASCGRQSRLTPAFVQAQAEPSGPARGVVCPQCGTFLMSTVEALVRLMAVEDSADPERYLLSRRDVCFPAVRRACVG